MDLVNDNTWEHSGERLTYTSGWKAHQPNNLWGSQDCAKFFVDGWDDAECDLNITFLCEVNN